VYGYRIHRKKNRYSSLSQPVSELHFLRRRRHKIVFIDAALIGKSRALNG